MLAQHGEPKAIDFAVFGERLSKVLIATGNKLTREWPLKYREVTGGRELLVMHIRAAHTTYLSALYLGGDVPPDPRRKPEFCATLPVLNRSLLDSLFSILFLLEDLPSRCEWFWEADWKETRLDLDRFTAEYGHAPDWQPWLKQLAEHCDNGLAHAKLTPTQAANPTSLRSWPNPGAMANHGVSPNTSLPPLRAFMKYVNDYFYIDLSQQTHLGGWGMVKRAGFLIDEIRSLEETEALMQKNRYAHIGQTVALVLSMASEIERHFNFGLKQEALFIWGVTVPTVTVAKELYEKRYRDLLT
jgi:hypothetical protein